MTVAAARLQYNDGAFRRRRDGSLALLGLLAGQVAFVTGGSQGLGKAITARASEAGAIGSVFDLDPTLSKSSLPAGFGGFAGDVTDAEALKAALKGLVADHGSLDFVVANAGIVPPMSTTTALDLDEWDRVMAVNVRGVAATIKHAAELMTKRGGSILVMASGASFRANPRQMAYATSKHAVLGIVRAAARDLGRYGIRVNALAPGPIATEALVGRVRGRAATSRSEIGTMMAMAGKSALGRLATEDEVAKAAMFLLSDLASGITGAIIPVDGGRL